MLSRKLLTLKENLYIKKLSVRLLFPLKQFKKSHLRSLLLKKTLLMLQQIRLQSRLQQSLVLIVMHYQMIQTDLISMIQEF